MNKLVVVIMGQNCEKFLPMCLESVKDADAIVFCDGGSTDKTNEIFTEHINKACDTAWINNKYDQEDKAMNGKQRNFYLEYVKRNYPNDWCLCLDADEVVEDLTKLKDFVNQENVSKIGGLWSVKMRHFHNDLGHEDATQPIHFVPNRLFKISDAGLYPEVEHPVLMPAAQCIKEGEEFKQTMMGKCPATTIWHLAHINHCFNIKGRYEKNLKHSNMHSKEFLDQWNLLHCMGKYPNKEIDPTEIPEVILNNFHIDKDIFYFQNRGIELKHSIMVKQWADYFKPSSVLDLGCGRGCYLYFWNWYCNDCCGIELSQWAVDHAYCKGIVCDTIAEPTQCDSSDEELDYEYELITAIDVLEHLSDSDLSATLDNMKNYGHKFIFSIPFIGDPNLENDKTHLQFHTKDEWKAIIESHGIKVEDVPADWLYAGQLLIGKKA
jgi:glycosyltransferase involved in cell wall biosynthesis